MKIRGGAGGLSLLSPPALTADNAIGRAAIDLVLDVMAYQEALEALRKETEIWMLSNDFMRRIATT